MPTGAEIIYSGGSETISAGGTDGGAQISGGTQFDYGTATGVTVFTGSQVVESGGTASDTTVSNGGTEIVSSGGTDGGATISVGGEQDVQGHASGTTITGGSQTVEGSISAASPSPPERTYCPGRSRPPGPMPAGR